MKNLFSKVASLMMLLATMSIMFVSCSSDEDITLLEGVSVTISYDSAQFTETAYAGQIVSITNVTTQAVYSGETDASGKATFISVVPGVYTMSISHDATTAEKENMITNPGANNVVITGNLSGFQVYAEGASGDLKLQAGVVSSVVISKFYTNGTRDNLDEKYKYDYYYTIYNNSEAAVDLTDKYFGVVDSYYSNPFGADKEDFVYLREIVSLGGETLAAGESRVYCLQAIDHTATATKSVDLSGADYEIRATPSTNGDKKAPGSSLVPDLAFDFTTYSTGDYLNWIGQYKGGITMIIFESSDVEGLEKVSANPESTGTQWYHKKVSTSNILDGVDFTKYKVADDGSLDTEYMEKYTRLPSFIDTYTYLSENNGYLGIAFVRNVKETIEGRTVLADTNNSLVDFSKTTVLDPQSFTVVEPVITTE